jgi:hypothetical protein
MTFDIDGVSYAEHDWPVLCNLSKIGPGVLGFMCRFGFGGSPPLVAVMIARGPAYEDPPYGYWMGGHIHAWTKELWVPGKRLLAAGWPANQPHWETNHRRQFQNGRRIPPRGLDAILDCLTTDQVRTIALETHVVTGRWPAYKRPKRI